MAKRQRVFQRGKEYVVTGAGKRSRRLVFIGLGGSPSFCRGRRQRAVRLIESKSRNERLTLMMMVF